MQRLSISAVSSTLPSDVVEQLNQRHNTLVKTIEIDFADTGFFQESGFHRVELVQNLAVGIETELRLLEDSETHVLKAVSTIPIKGFRNADLYDGFETAKLEAVKVLSAILEHFNLDSRTFKMRAFHIQGEISGRKIRKDMDDADASQRVHYATDAAAMHENEFWKIIESVDKKALELERQGDAVEPVVANLSKSSVAEICSFHNHLTNALFSLDTKPHHQALHDECSDDSFLYVRCYVVGQGRKHYESVLANPSQMPQEYKSFELLLFAADEAWSNVTGRDSMYLEIDTENSFESGSNRKGWELEQKPFFSS